MTGIPTLRPRGTIALAALLLASAPIHGADPIVALDLLRLRTVESIDVAANGSVAVATIRSFVTIPAADEAAAPEWRSRAHLWRLDLGSAEPHVRPLTFGPRLDHAPVVSPDGRRVAFLRAGTPEDGLGVGRLDGAEAPTAEADQVWLLDLDGGEARQVTAFPRGAEAPRWSPEGRRLLVAARIPDALCDDPGPRWPEERPGRETTAAVAGAGDPGGDRTALREWLDGNAALGNPVVTTRLDFQEEQQLRVAASWRHLFVIEPDRPELAPRRVTRGRYDHFDGAWMPDGRRLVFCAGRPESLPPDRAIGRGLWIVSADGTGLRELLPDETWRCAQPEPGPDGSVVAVLASPVADGLAYGTRRLGLVPVGEEDPPAEPIWLTDAERFDGSVHDAKWMPARSSLVFTTASHGAFPLLTTGLGLLEPAVLVDEVEGEPVGVHAFGVGGGAIVYAATTVQRPSAIRLRDGRGDRLLLDPNPWVRDREVVAPRRGTITRPDGLEVDYWLMPPARFDASRRYPLVVAIHGGPMAMWGPGERTMWHEFQMLCSWGYGVLYCNPRGSSGSGAAFLRANRADWGAGPGGDVLAVVDHVLAHEPWVDEDRLVVTGGSYGGYLTAWIVAHDHRFKAAVAQRGVYDLATFFGEGNAWRLVGEAMGGFPWDAAARPVIRRESPFTDVQRIRTPLLIMHASDDLRTGVSQSEMLYRALKVLGRPVEYVRYPDAGHDLSRSGDPRQRVDRLLRIVEFFERSVSNERPAPRAPRDG